MKNYIARENATGNLYKLRAKDDDTAYRLFGKIVFLMADAFDPDFDTGNVDIDLVDVTKIKANTVTPLFKHDE